MKHITIDDPASTEPLCVPVCPRCSFPMNVHFSQEPISGGAPIRAAVFGHCARCMHVEHITFTEVILEQAPESNSAPAA